MKVDLTQHLAQALSDADRSFAETGDVMEALSWVAFAAKAGEPLPPRIGRWLYAALNAYRSGEARSLDAALGLKLTGKANPRQRLLNRSKLQRALARMAVLHDIGATIEQAATLVSRLAPDSARTTLEDRYGRSGLGASRSPHRRWCIAEVRKVLSEFPDKPREAAQAKAAILRLYAEQ